MSPRKLIVETDGGSRGNPGPAGFGALVRDARTGQVLAEIAEAIGHATNNVAEYRGLIAGLQAAASVDPVARVEVRMDSKLVVEQMSGRWKVKHPDMMPLALRARDLAAGLGAVAYTWVPRSRNAHADRLANEAMDAAAQGREWRHTEDGAADGSADGSADGATKDSWSDEESEGGEESERGPATGWSRPTAVPTTTLLLRHGQTALSGEQRFAGIGDHPLTELGVEQARAAARALKDRGVEVIVTSPLGRCRDTAAEVAAATGAPVRVEEGFRETDFGEWEGLTFEEVRRSRPAEMEAWLADPTVPPPGGESFAAAGRRVRVALDKLMVRHRRRRVLVVTHVTPIKLLVVAALRAPRGALFRMHVDVASMSAIDWYDDGPAVLRLFNDTHHLE